MDRFYSLNQSKIAFNSVASLAFILPAKTRLSCLLLKAALYLLFSRSVSGREALNSKSINVYAMPRMKKFLEQNGPWSQLISLQNISITEINNNSKLSIDPNVIIQPIEVPHRAEFSETVGYKIYGPNKKVLFIPDIDKWYLWEKSIIDEIKQVDYALIDATFYDSKEINYRDVSEIPHPFVVESMELFDAVKLEEKNKIFFIHLNHTNPLLDKSSDQYKFVKDKGYNIAEEGMKLEL